MASRKEEKERRRQERLEREQQAAASSRRKRLAGFAAAGVLAGAAVAAIAIVLVAGGDDGRPDVSAEDLSRLARAAGCKAATHKDDGAEHTASPVEYKTNPPTSGQHNPVPAEDNKYAESPKAEALVHSLEHGRVVVQYAPDAPEPVKEALTDFYDDDPDGVILTPNTTGMPYQVAATAWRRSLTCERFTSRDRVLAALEAFKLSYRGKGPEPVPF